MSVAQLAGLYLGRRDRYGYPLPPEDAPLPPSARGAFEYRCRALGLRDPDVIAELWGEREAKAAEKAGPRKRKRR